MALPVLNTPIHELTLTSTGETIKFRPFLVKEEKILLMALESDNENEMLGAMKQIISNCVINDIDIEKLPLFDVQYIFLQLRVQSVGEVSTLRFQHSDGTNSKGEECSHIQNIEINIGKIKPEALDGHNRKIQLTDDVGVVMEYPRIDLYQKLSELEKEQNPNMMDAVIDIFIDSIEMIYQKDETFYKDDHSKEELEEFLSSLNNEQFEKIRSFFGTMPYIRHYEEYTCDKCGCVENIVIQGIEDFFA